MGYPPNESIDIKDCGCWVHYELIGNKMRIRLAKACDQYVVDNKTNGGNDGL